LVDDVAERQIVGILSGSIHGSDYLSQIHGNECRVLLVPAGRISFLDVVIAREYVGKSHHAVSAGSLRLNNLVVVCRVAQHEHRALKRGAALRAAYFAQRYRAAHLNFVIHRVAFQSVQPYLICRRIERLFVQIGLVREGGFHIDDKINICIGGNFRGGCESDARHR
jgi:hypothetical protein